MANRSSKLGATPDSPGRVINIASVAGLQTVDVTTGEDGGLAQPGQGTFSYGPSKAACIHLSKMQASKLAPKNIMVNVICPGVFPSRMTAFGLSKFKDTLVSGQPTGRLGKPSDFGGVVLFLSSVGKSTNGCICGESIHADRRHSERTHDG